MEIISLPYHIGIMVWQELEKKGIEKRKNPKTGLISFDFTREELDSIEKLKIVDNAGGNLKGISNLRNLKSLSITRQIIKISGHRAKSKVFIPRDHYTLKRNIPTITDKDIYEIEKLEKLESLSLVGQSCITSLDVSKLTKLKELNISGNMRLESIEGLDKLQSLEWLTMIANHELEEVKGLNECLNNGHVEDVSLDPQLFPRAVNYDYRTNTEDTQLIQKMQNGDINIEFFETLNEFNDIKMNIAQMLLVHNKAKEIVKSFDEIKPTRKERIMITQAYLGDKVVYDKESIKSNHTHSKDGIVQGPIHGANGIFNCLCYNTCVCQGYSRGAKYLLELQGIVSREVSCISGKDDGSFAEAEKSRYAQGLKLPDDGYHSILLVQDFKSQEYGYCDPCWNAAFYKSRGTMPYMLMGTDEIKKTHTLSLEEQNIGIMSNSYRREVIERETKFAIQKYKESTIGRASKQEKAVDLKGIKEAVHQYQQNNLNK